MADTTTIIGKVKTGLGLSSEQTSADGTVQQKIDTVVAYAGFGTDELEHPLVIGCIVVGVTDIWELGAGTIKMSEAFHMLLENYRTSKLSEEA